METFTIEYNFSQGQFHHYFDSKKNKPIPNTNGYQVVITGVPSPLESVFCAIMLKYYIDRAGDDLEARPTVGVLRHEFAVFMDYMRLLSEHKVNPSDFKIQGKFEFV